jgi:hypothetical protein
MPLREDRPERLFRDDAGAAIERVAQLEEENAQLRAEVNRLRDLREVKGSSTVRIGARSPSPWVVLGIAAAPAFLGIVLIAASLSSSTPPPARVENPPPRAPRVAKVSAAKPECSPPYFYDSSGVKHYKASCLGR